MRRIRRLSKKSIETKKLLVEWLFYFCLATLLLVPVGVVDVGR